LLGLLWATLAGCANLSSLWTQTFPTKTPPPAESDAPLAQLPKPTPHPALYIGNPPEALADAPKKQDIVPVVQFQEVAPKESPSNSDPLTPLRELYRRAAQQDATLQTYVMRVRSREVVKGTQKPEEIRESKYRKEPYSVYFRWVGTEGKGRELVYVKNQHGNMIHTLLAAGDNPFMAAGRRFKIAPDSFLIRDRSRYQITDAGMTPLIERFGRLVKALEAGDRSQGTGEYRGLVKRPEFEKEVAEVRQVLPPKADPTLPKGGERLLFFDTTHHLPVLVIAMDETGREVEYYCHDRIWLNHPLTDDDFNPDRLWPGAK
jgi:hypothetical protein